MKQKLLYVFVIYCLAFNYSWAQCTILTTATSGGITLAASGGSPSAVGVAYNPVNSRYHVGYGGSTINDAITTFDATGTFLAIIASGQNFDYRGIWWNSNTNQLEGNGYNAAGVGSQVLSSGFPTTTNVFQVSITNPTAQQGAAYDDVNNLVIMYDGSGSILRYDRATGALSSTLAITGLPVSFSNLNSTASFYTGCAGKEYGVYDYVLNNFYFINTSGAYVGTSSLPGGSPTPSFLHASYTNGQLWLADGSNNFHNYNVLTPCSGSPASITGTPTTICPGATTTLSDATTGGAWSTANTTIATVVSGTGVVTGVSGGTAIITYSTGCAPDATMTITVNPEPAAISGASSVCLGLTTTFTDGTAFGAWTTSNTAVAGVGSSSGIVTGNTAGTATISYTLVTGCAPATQTITVNPLPSAITGTTVVCVGLTTTLSDAGGGTWASNNLSVATVVSGTGVVTGVAAGTATITYTLATGCTTTTVVSVSPLPAAISGTTNVCAGLTTGLSDASGAGTWTTSTSSVATVVSGTGVVSGVSEGTTTITFTLTSTGCTTSTPVTVNPLPSGIGGTTNVCAGSTTTLSDATAFGSWSSSTSSVATVGSTTGIVSGVLAGTTTITYTLNTGCIITTPVTVNALPAAITSPAAVVCVGLSTTLSDPTTGGAWASSNTSLATIISGTGVMTGVSNGTLTITYTTPSGCNAFATATVNALPAPVTGTLSVCAGLTTTLSDGTGGGAWTTSTSSVATVASNVVTGVASGTSTITYTLPTGCIATVVVTVNPLPAVITGTTNTCPGLTTTLSDATAGGTWASGNVTLATVGTSSGIVAGVAAGTTTITYTLATGCIMTTPVTVNPLPSAITGTTNVCVGLATALTDGTPGGGWTTSTSSVATVAGNIVTGVSAGTTTITYTLPTGCYMTTVVTVNPLPSAITGTTTVCVNATTALADATPFGSWTSSNTLIAAVGTASGVVTGAAAGTATITYTLGTGCITTASVLVNPIPAVITGVNNVCVGSTTTLSDATVSGTWSSSATTIASVVSGTGVVTGVTSGILSISYTLTTTGCFITAPVTVNPLPSAISGTLSACIGNTSTLSDAGGGTWTTSTSSVATVVSGTGVVTGVAAGTTTITYTLPVTGCTTTSTFTVNPFPAAISGTANVCVASTTTLTDASPFGSWTSSNTSVALAGSGTGVVTGVTAGTATITYTLATGCFSSTTLTVNPLPAAITGTFNVCIGLTTTLSDANTGGLWTSSNTSLATVGSVSGTVTGVASGTPAITYTLPTGCTATTFITVNSLPANITGTASVCAGLTTTLSDANTGGTWTTTTSSVATISSTTGTVNGLVAGTSTITYTLPTGCYSTIVVTVNPLPNAITGTPNMCPGTSTSLSSTTPSGGWSSSNTSFVIIGAGTGVATGIAAGTATITYTVGTGCIITAPVTVNPLPATITGTTSVCAGLTTNLTDANAGGTWTTSTSSVATVVAGTGLVSGVAPGTTTITYTLPTGCMTTTMVTVNPLPSAITGTPNTCIGATTTLADATSFGAWSSSTSSVATVGSGTGVVTGVAAGTTTITYTLGTGCIITTPVTVNPFPSAITGTTHVCVGLTTALSDATTGGNWSSSNTSVASVVAGTGVVTGASAGTATITYTAPTGCAATTALTVNPLPAAISGSNNVCAGLTTTLSDTNPGGTWTSSTSSVATVVSGTGVVSGVLAGTTTITYTLSTGCINTMVMTVNPLPAGITGTTNVCAGLTTALSDATLFGAWSSSATGVATVVSGSGVVTGLVAGTTTITYTLATGCIATTPLTVNPLPVAITPAAPTVCVGLATTLSDANTGGAWTTVNTTIATVISGSGVVTGVLAGTATITYTLPTGCTATRVLTVNPLPAAITGTFRVCTGLTTTLSDATPSGTWTSSDPTQAPVGATTGVVTGLSVGTPTITYMLGTGCISTQQVTVNPLPAAITGTINVCVGLTTTLSDATPGGAWSTSTSSVATVVGGVVTGVLAGTTTITYTLPTGCIMTSVVTVNPLPAAITGTTNVCVSATTALSDATPFGSWTSSTSSVATVTSSTGVVSGVLAGTTTITYTLSTGCIITTPVTVNALPAAITGTNNVCAGLTTALSDATGVGAWTSSNTTVATVVSGTGVVTGVLAGTTTITYTLPTGCTALATVTVNPLPVSITGPTAVCRGLSITLSDGTAGGAWTSSTSSVATVVSGTGVLTGVSAGTTTVTYTLPVTGCIMTAVITVNPLPAGITGTTNVCVGLTTTLSDVGGGTWSSSNLGLATVGTSSGIVTGLAAGTPTITYTLPTGCITTTPVTVNPLPSAITGTMNVCAGLTTALSDAGGGTWASGSTSVATVNSATGVVTGVVTGTATITYTLPTGCITTTVITVNPNPAAITGLDNVCFGLTTPLADPTPFGSWTSSNTTLATIGSATGLVTGLSAGPLTITYMLATGCISTLAFTVNPLPTAILGSTTVCVGLTTALTDAGGGTWASSNTAVATIAGTGVMTGVLAGTTTITYTLPTGCIITSTATVNPLPAAISGATTNVCPGLTISFSDATPAGTWSSSNTAIATVVSGTGVVTGVSAGTMTLTYTLPTSCIMTTVVTVDPLPATITGTMDVCEGLTTALSDATPSGTWTSGNTAVATINSSTGVVTGILAGTTTITYTLPTSCIMTTVVTVNPLPAAITGIANVCEGLTTTLSDVTPSGTWTSGNTAVATIDPSTGLVNGIVAGTATVTYTIPTGCIMTTVLTVNPLPATITGTMDVCAGLTTTLSDATPSGTWSSSNTGLATVDAITGVVTGVSAGNPTITYTIPTGCIMTTVVTVNPLPAAITGTMDVCEGLTTMLSDATPSGTWSSSNTATATIDVTTGMVTGVVAGTVTMTYTIPTGCIMTTVFTVNPLPSAITGTMNVCAGLTTALSDAGGGTWSNDLTPIVTVATINTITGVVTGVSAGTNTITYTLPTGCITTTVVTVDPLPAAITGTMNVCEGLTTALSDATASGAWTSGNTAVATIDASTGVVTGVLTGTTTITYTLPTSCIMTAVVTVNPLPAAITGTMNVCAGLTTMMSDATAGGTWTSSDISIATVGTSTGIVTGVMGGTATLTYMLPTGCIMTSVVTVDPLPAAITGTMNVCAGLTTALSDASTGGSWSSAGSTIATVDAGTGVVTGVAAGTTTITYTLPTGCIMTASLVVNPLPASISGTAYMCAGQTTTLGDVSAGGSWTSGNTTIATIDVTGVATGVTAGTTTITYTLPTGCIMTRVITVNQLPTIYTVTGGGAYCTAGSGVHVLLSGSVAGINYQLYNGATMVGGPVAGTGLGLDFGLLTAVGTYTVSATDAVTGCTSDMISGAPVSLLPLPTAHTVTGGGNYCAGGTGVHVGLAVGDAGVSYQLYIGGILTGSPITGAGSALDFGLQTVADTYTVVGTDAVTTCTNMMTGKATVTVTTPVTPGVNITYSGYLDTICAGSVSTFTATPVNGGSSPTYVWKVNGVNKATTNPYTYVPVNGDIVNVIMTSNAICPSPDTAADTVTMTIIPVTHPVVTISADPGDTVCNGTSVTYSAAVLFGGGAASLTWVKNGTVVDSGLSYVDVPTNADIINVTMHSNYRCRDTNLVFSNNLLMTVDSVIIPIVDIDANPGASISAGTSDTLTAFVTDGGINPAFQWYLNGSVVPGETTSRFIRSNFKNGDSISCRVTRRDACARATTNGVRIHVGGVGVTNIAGTVSNISVVPNPNKGEFVVTGSLSVNEDVEVSLELTNMLGQVVYKEKVIAHGGDLDQRIQLNSTLANGMYLLNLHSDVASKVFHVVIEQ